eukprot:gene11729-13851_t
MLSAPACGLANVLLQAASSDCLVLLSCAHRRFQVSAADGSNRPAPRRALDDSDALPGSDSDYGLEATLSQRQDYPETLPEQYYAKWDYFSALPGYDVYSEEDIRWVQEQEHSAVLVEKQIALGVVQKAEEQARLQADILDLSNKFFISDKTLVVVDGGGKTKLFTIDIQSQLVLYMLHLVRGYSSCKPPLVPPLQAQHLPSMVAGGAIYVAGNATLISCTFAGNTASAAVPEQLRAIGTGALPELCHSAFTGGGDGRPQYKASGDIYVDTS